MDPIKELEREQLRSDVPAIAPGDTVKVSVKVVEGSRERIQIFEGTVMRLRGGGLNQRVTVSASRQGGVSAPSWPRSESRRSKFGAWSGRRAKSSSCASGRKVTTCASADPA